MRNRIIPKGAKKDLEVSLAGRTSRERVSDQLTWIAVSALYSARKPDGCASQDIRVSCNRPITLFTVKRS